MGLEPDSTVLVADALFSRRPIGYTYFALEPSNRSPWWPRPTEASQVEPKRMLFVDVDTGHLRSVWFIV